MRVSSLLEKNPTALLRQLVDQSALILGETFVSGRSTSFKFKFQSWIQDRKKNGLWWHRVALDLENVLLAFTIQTFMAKVVYTAGNPGDYNVSKKPWKPHN